MKGLLYKDLITVACAGRRSLPVILLVYLAAAVVADAPAMLFGFIFVLGLFSLSSLSYDEYAHWETYARTLPVSRAALVGSKYLLCLLCVAGGGGLSMGIAAVFAAARGGALSMESAAGCLGAMAAVLAYMAILLPMTYRFGATQARNATMAVFAAVFVGGMAVARAAAVSPGLGAALHALAARLNALPPAVYLAGLPAAGLAALAVSLPCSLRLAAAREA